MTNYTSYKGAIQVNKGGPLVYFDAQWPSGMWRKGFEQVLAGINWEGTDSPINFIELIGHTADNKAHWLVGSSSIQTPMYSHIIRHKAIVTLGSPVEKEIHKYLLDALSLSAPAVKQGMELVPIVDMNLDDFPVVFSINR